MRHGLLSVQLLRLKQVKGVRSSNVWESMSKMCVSLGSRNEVTWGWTLKWWVSPTNPWDFPTKNDQHLGWPLGVLLFKETPTWWWFGNMGCWTKNRGIFPPKSSISIGFFIMNKPSILGCFPLFGKHPYFFMFRPVSWGSDSQFDEHFFRWVGSTTNQWWLFFSTHTSSRRCVNELKRVQWLCEE